MAITLINQSIFVLSGFMIKSCQFKKKQVLIILTDPIYKIITNRQLIFYWKIVLKIDPDCTNSNKNVTNIVNVISFSLFLESILHNTTIFSFLTLIFLTLIYIFLFTKNCSSLNLD